MRLASDDGAGVHSAVQKVAEDLGYKLRTTGMEVSEGAGAAPTWRERAWRRRRDLTTLASGLLIATAVVMGLLGAPEVAVAGVFATAIAVGGYYIARVGWASLRTAHTLDMNALMTIATP